MYKILNNIQQQQQQSNGASKTSGDESSSQQNNLNKSLPNSIKLNNKTGKQASKSDKNCC